MDQSKLALSDEIIEKINRIKMRRRSEDARQQGGRGTGFVLSYLHYNGGNALPGELGQNMRVSTPRVTAILNEMEAQGLISRSISPRDRRNIRVTITDKGKEVVQERLSKQKQNIRLLVERLAEEDSRAFVRILDILDQLIEEQGWGI